MKHLRVFRLSGAWIAVTSASLFVYGCLGQAEVQATVALGNMKADRILFLGNSICIHPPYSGWSDVGGFGMAASAPEKDYVHLLTNTIDSHTGGQLALDPEPAGVLATSWTYGAPLPTCTANILNVADFFERNYNTWDNARIQQQINGKPDIVVLQFGENMSGGTPAQFKTALENLMTGLKNGSNPDIFVTSFILSSNPTIDAIKQQVCAEDPTHRVFVPISNVEIGLIGHPSDRGMATIADTLFGSMVAHSAPEPGSLVMLSIAGVFLGGLMPRSARWSMLRRLFGLRAAICLALGGVPAAIAAEPSAEPAFHHNWAVSEHLPFSFVYDARPSSELIGEWKRTVQEKTIDETKAQRTVTLEDPKTGLYVRAVLNIYTDTPGVDWTLDFTNRGNQDTPILEQVNAVDTMVHSGRAEKPAIISRLRPHTEDWVPFDEMVQQGKVVEFAPANGRSSDGASGFFNLSWNGGGVITAIGWTGQWRAAVEQTTAGLRVTAGMQDMRLKLHPGETIRSPRIMQVYWSGDDPWHGYNVFRRAMFAHVMPRIDGQIVMPPLAHTSISFHEDDRSTEADVLSHLASLKGLGFEYLWLDAFCGKDDFPTVGNYVFPLLQGFNQKRYPAGIKPIGDAVRREGMKFLMWFEPERIVRGTLMAQKHPEWVVLPPDGKGGMFNAGWGMFNLGVPEARKYLTRYLNASIKEYGIRCLRIDNAVQYRELWGLLDKAEPDRRGMAEIRYVNGLYRLWDDLLAANPSIFIDNCASGGGRIDLETCSRSIPLWRTDATIGAISNKDLDQIAIQNQAATAGLNRYLPLSTGGQMGASPYHFRSGFNGGICFCDDIRPTDYPRDLLKQAIAEAKRLRPYLLGDMYALSDATIRSEDWCVVQYHRPKEQKGMVLAFRRHRAANADLPVAIRGIDPNADYEVTLAYDYQPVTPQRLAGAKLNSMKLHIESRPGSLLLEYRKLPAGK